MQTFPIIESLDIQHQITFSNITLRNREGAEQTIVKWQAPVRKYTLSKKILTPSNRTILLDFFNSIKGSKDPILYRDKSDYQATATQKVLGTGVYTQGVVIKVGEIYALFKKYVCGANTHYRPIYQAIDLEIYDESDNLVSGWEFLEGGKITGLAGQEYTASFTFLTPCKFTEDDLESTVTGAKQVFSLTPLTIREHRFKPVLTVHDVVYDNLLHTLEYAIADKTTLSDIWDNETIVQESGYTVTSQEQSYPIHVLKFGDRSIIPQKDMEYLIALWLCGKGSGCFFTYPDLLEIGSVYLARFRGGDREATMTYNLVAPDTNTANPIFSCAGLEARIYKEELKNDSGYLGWLGSVLTLASCTLIEY